MARPSASNSTTPYALGSATQYAKTAPPSTSRKVSQLSAQAGSVEDVVAEHQGHLLGADEVGADDEGLGQPVGRGLLGVADRDAELRAVAEQPLESRCVVRAW